MSQLEPVTRETLKWELAKNAATKPLAVGAGAVVVVVGIVIGALWLVPIGVAVYLALAVATFFDGNESERVGKRVYARRHALTARSTRAREAEATKRYAPEIARPLLEAQAQEREIRAAIESAKLPFREVTAEVDSLMGEMTKIADRAQVIYDFLAGQNVDELRMRLSELEEGAQGEGEAADARRRAADAVHKQLEVTASLAGELDRFYAEMEHMNASLGVVRAQLVRMSVASDTAVQTEIAGQVRDLRERVSTVADGMAEAASQVATSDRGDEAGVVR